MAAKHSHMTPSAAKTLGLVPPTGALTRHPTLRPRHGTGRPTALRYPLPHYTMWWGNTMTYQYNRAQIADFGEGEAMSLYHQYYAHAKDPADRTRCGRDFELMLVQRGKPAMKPLPKVQYVKEGSKPKWCFKTWHDAFEPTDIWQREVQYEEHIPKHLDAERPLCPLAPKTTHKYIHNAHMKEIRVTICPFVFSYGHSMQKAVIDFYRRVLGRRTVFPKDKVSLVYAVDAIAPVVEVVWVDDTVYRPPIHDGMPSGALIQRIMEMSWLVGDRIEASGKKLAPLTVDDYKWHETIVYKKRRAEREKDKTAHGSGKPGK